MAENSKIPFVDLVAMHRELEPELEGVFHKVMNTAGFIGGPMVEEFEYNFAKYCDSEHCLGVNSGTDALRFALTAAGVRPGDIVITVPLTFIATTEAISQAGARPDFVDVDGSTFTMDPERLADYLDANCALDAASGQWMHRKLQRPVTAIVPVHLYGQTVDMDPILEIATRYRLLVIEDACQAHGAEYFSKRRNRWLKAGSMGHAAAFSFYPGKNLGACGEAGAATTNDAAIARQIRMLRDHGQSKKYYHEIEGYNGRLDSLQAGFLSVKLKHLNRWNEQRRESARVYDELLAPMSSVLKLPQQPVWARSVFHLYVVRTQNRDELQKHLDAAGVGTGIHYPIPVHLQTAYAGLDFKQGDFPITEEISQQILSLPMFAGIKPEQQNRVAEAVSDFASIRSVA